MRPSVLLAFLLAMTAFGCGTQLRYTSTGAVYRVRPGATLSYQRCEGGGAVPSGSFYECEYEEAPSLPPPTIIVARRDSARVMRSGKHASHRSAAGR